MGYFSRFNQLTEKSTLNLGNTCQESEICESITNHINTEYNFITKVCSSNCKIQLSNECGQTINKHFTRNAGIDGQILAIFQKSWDTNTHLWKCKRKIWIMEGKIIGNENSYKGRKLLSTKEYWLQKLQQKTTPPKKPKPTYQWQLRKTSNLKDLHCMLC